MPARDDATRKLLNARIRVEFAKHTPAEATLTILRDIHARQKLANAAVSGQTEPELCDAPKPATGNKTLRKK